MSVDIMCAKGVWTKSESLSDTKLINHKANRYVFPYISISTRRLIHERAQRGSNVV